MLRTARRHRYKRNEVVFHDGDPGETLHMIMKGHFAVRISTPLGDVAMVRVLGEGDHFGELAVLAPGPRNGDAISLEAGETLALQRDDLQRLRETAPKIDEVLTLALVDEVRRLSAALVEALYVPVEQRVWRRLLQLGDLYGPEDPVVIPLTQDDLAQLVGTTRPTLNQILKAGEKRGFLHLGRGRLELCDTAALGQLVH